MKNLLAFLFLILSIATQAQDPKPQLLKEPASWEFEKFPLPPGFATGIPYQGVEELRFSPGMFKKDSATYFTYAFVAELDNMTAISKKEVHDYLFKYFTGLCSSVAKDRKLVIDTSQINVALEKNKDVNANEVVYTGFLNVFGVFADGAHEASGKATTLKFYGTYDFNKDNKIISGSDYFDLGGMMNAVAPKNK